VKRIAAHGTLNCDLLFQGVPRLPSEGEEIFSEKFEMQLGGGFPAAMINLHRLGVPVSLSTFLGEDLFSKFLEGRIHDFGLDFLNLYEPPPPPDRDARSRLPVLPSQRTTAHFCHGRESRKFPMPQKKKSLIRWLERTLSVWEIPCSIYTAV
jgi:sugar/nucleoside kinase (ribokinase family)